MRSSTVSNIEIAGLVLLLVTALTAGILLIGYTTSIGPWAFSDSTSYITAARNLASGLGLTYPDSNGQFFLLTWHPPFFPTLLSLPILFGANALQSARWLNAALFGILAALSIWIVWRFTRSLFLSVGTGLLVLLSVTFMRIYSGVMSEGIFLVLGFSGLFLLVEYLIAPLKPWKLILAALLLGFSYLARYTGMAFIITGGIAVLSFTVGSLKKRLSTFAIYFLGAGLLPLFWTSVVFIDTGSFGGRDAGLPVPISAGIQSYFREFWITLQGWIPFINRGNQYIPALAKLVILTAVFVAAVVLLAAIAHRKDKTASLRPIALWGIVLGTFVSTYVAFHLASFLFTPARPDVDARLLSPVLLSVLLAAPMLFGSYALLIKPAWIFSVIFLGISLVSVWYFQQPVRDHIVGMHFYGEGYTSLRWKEEPAFDQIRQLDNKTLLYSNDPALVMFYTNRVSKLIDVTSLKNGAVDNPEKPSYLMIFYPQAETQLGVSLQPWLEDNSSRFKPIFIGRAAGIYQWEINTQ